MVLFSARTAVDATLAPARGMGASVNKGRREIGDDL